MKPIAWTPWRVLTITVDSIAIVICVAFLVVSDQSSIRIGAAVLLLAGVVVLGANLLGFMLNKPERTSRLSTQRNADEE